MLTSYEWMLAVSVVLGVGSFYAVRYIRQKNADRHPLETLRKQLNIPGSIEHEPLSPWWNFILGCVFPLLSAYKISNHQVGFTIDTLLAVVFFILGIQNIWIFYKSVKTTKT